MRVSHSNNPHSYQQQRTNTKDKGFADMLAGMAANKHGRPEPPKNGCHCTRPTETEYSHLRLVNPHMHHGTEIKLTAEQKAELEKMKRGAPSGSECLEKYEEVENPNFFVPKPYELPAPKYPASIYDIPADDLKNQLEAAEKACENLDTTGMSKAEIYNSIETIYKNYLGNDFKLPAIIGGVLSDHSINLSNAHLEFNSQLRGHGISRNDIATVKEAKGYSGMSDSEIKAAVRDKYPKVMTLKDCMLMSTELRDLGFEKEGAVGSRMKERIFATMGPGWSPEAQKVFDTMLDMPADFDAFMSKFDAFEKNDYKYYLPQNADEMFEQLMSWLGGSGLYSQEMLNQLRGMVDKVPLDQDLSKVVIGANNQSAAQAVNEQTATNTIAEKMPFLSKEQSEYLSGKYDVNNLSKEDEKALLDELEKMGIISKDENHKVYARTAKVPPEWMHGGLRAVEGKSAVQFGDSLNLEDFSSALYYPSLSKGMTLYDYLQGMISDENRLYEEGKEQYGEKAVSYMTDLMQTHQKLLAVLEEIKTGS